MNTFKKLTDETLMPWGKFKGEELQDVPVWYLYFCEKNIRSGAWSSDAFRNGLLVYIDENRDVLEKELKK